MLDSSIRRRRQVKRKVLYYNLDVIISVGYRVKSPRGTQFRIWANKILKIYLLKGHIVNHRLSMVEEDVNQIKGQLNEIEFMVQTSLTPNEGIFFDGQIPACCRQVRCLAICLAINQGSSKFNHFDRRLY